jgi:hypothetical protein
MMPKMIDDPWPREAAYNSTSSTTLHTRPKGVTKEIITKQMEALGRDAPTFSRREWSRRQVNADVKGTHAHGGMMGGSLVGATVINSKR